MGKGFIKKIFTNVYFYLILFSWFILGFIIDSETIITDIVIDTLFISLITFIVFLIIYFINEDKKRKNFPIKGWKWIIYIFGWIGMLTLVFWIYQYALYLTKNFGNKFLSMEFHKRTYYWGWLIILIISILFLIWFFTPSENDYNIYKNLDGGLENSKVKDYETNKNYIELIFYDNKTKCRLEGELSLGGNIIGEVKNGSFNLIQKIYEEMFSYEKELVLTGLTNDCFEKDNNLPYMEIWENINLEYYFKNNVSCEFVAELTPRTPRYYGEMMGFVRPEEVKEYVNQIYFPSNIERDRIEKIVDYVGGKIRYRDDYLLFKENDYWQTPKETLNRNEGDCEDWAAAILSLILADNPNAQCYEVFLLTHLSIFCYSNGVAGFYDQEKIKSRVSLLGESEGEDKIRIRNMIYEYFKRYGISPNERGVYGVFNNHYMKTFDSNEEFVDWIYNLF